MSPTLSRRTELKGPSSPLDPKNPFLGTTEHDNDLDVETSGLTGTKFCDTLAKLVKVIGSLVGNTFKYPTEEEHALQKQFGVYFVMIGWTSEDTMSALADNNLPSPDTIVTKHETVSMIRPGIIMMM